MGKGATEWKTAKLGEVCQIIMGQSPDGGSYNANGDGMPLINGPVEFSEGAFGRTIRSKFTTQPTKLCNENDLILCVRGSTTGRMNIAAFDACIGRGVAAIRAPQYQPWINYFIHWKRDDIYRLGTGATFPNVSGAVLSELNLLLPPASEQHRIVGKERTIQHMMMTSFWHPGGQPMSAQQFMELLFGKLPEFFKNEVELRALWSDPKPAPSCYKPAPSCYKV